MSLHIIVIAVSMLLSSSAAFADAGFQRLYGGVGFERGVFVEPTRDGGFVVVGVANDRADRAESGEDVLVLRVDVDGKELWQRRLGGDDSDNGWAIRQVEDGFVLAGFTRSQGAGGFDFYLAGLDSEGELRWSKTFGGEGDDRCWALLVTSDGGFALAGETTSEGEGEEDFFLVRTDSTGEKLWSRSYGGAKGDRCFSLVESEDGGFLLAGQTYSEGAGDRDAFVVKTSSEGEFEWSKSFGGPAKDVGHSISRNVDGSSLVCGYTASTENGVEDPYLILLEDSGQLRWERTLSLPGMERSLTAEQAADGGFYLTGIGVDATRTRRYALLVKVDGEAGLLWSREILPTATGDSFGYTVRGTSDGCVLTGHSSVGSAGGTDLLLVRVVESSSVD